MKKIRLLLEELERTGILKNIIRVPNFPDEPQVFLFSATLKNVAKYSDGLPASPTAFGLSLFSKELALLRCLGEAVERFATVCYREKSVMIGSFGKATKQAIIPILFTGIGTHRGKKLGWVKGLNLTKNTSCLIPAQAVYLNYTGKAREVFLTPSISTGAAGGFTHESTLLRGIYEVIERDAFMTVYLNKIKAPSIDIEAIRSKNVATIRQKARRYGLELFLFDITNDLAIPSFLTLLIDRTGLGPSVCVGSKTNFSMHTAIVGSLEEAFLTRTSLRKAMYERKANTSDVWPNEIATQKERGLYWASPRMLSHLDFLLNQQPKKLTLSSHSTHEKAQLREVLTLLKQNHIDIFYADISLANFRKLGYLVYKVVIPVLQPLYLNEKVRVWRLVRLKRVFEYFGGKNFSPEKINSIPHPFH